MIEKEFLEDISKYKTKIIANLTKRQIFCFGVALFICVPLYHFLSAYFIQAFCLIICGIIGLPIMICGFIDLYGLPAEKFIFIVLKTMVFCSTSRKYKNENEYEKFFADAITEMDYTEKEKREIAREEKKKRKLLKKTNESSNNLPIQPSKKRKRRKK